MQTPDDGPPEDSVAASGRLADLAAAIDDVPVLIWVSGPDNAGVHFNRSWLEFTGRTLEEELGEGWMSSVHPEDLPVLEGTSTAFARREPFQIEFRLRRNDGAWRWMLDKAAPRFTANGRFTGYVGSCVDITEAKEAQAQARGSEERLKLAQEAANASGATTPLGAEAAQLYGLYAGAGEAESDFSGIIRFLRGKS